ncbi:hypothetical protein A7P93_06085 [Eikenella corrodens]|nr:hypothetical protein A7P93_06085 [Eikenella corrodens]
MTELVKFVLHLKAIGLHCLINFVCAIWLFCPAGYLKAMSWQSQGCASAKLKRWFDEGKAEFLRAQT